MKRSTRLVAAASLAWAGASIWAVATDSRLGEIVLLVAGIALLGSVWWLLRATERQRRQWQTVLDAMQAGIVLYDPDDRLVVANADFRRSYQGRGVTMREGESFEAMLRNRVRAGLVPEAAGREDAWITQRLGQRRANESQSYVREMADGRWRRIVEQRLPDGSWLGHGINVTELVENQRALDAARHEAERAHRLLHDAIEAMPAAVEIYDRQDRLVMFNARMVQIYPHMQGQVLLGETFETLVRRAVVQGHVPEASGQEERWLAERLAQRGRSDQPRLQRAPDGSWHHIYETPMPEGGLITVRLDSSAIVEQRDELSAARERVAAEHVLLDDAIEALPDAFALYDSDDRLLVCNQRYREVYRESAAAMVIGATFESILRHGLAHSQYPQAGSDDATRAAWLAERLRRHRAPDGVPILQELPGNQWLRIDERRTRSGGVAGVRTDVTEMVRTRQQLEALNSTVESSAAALRAVNAQLEELSATDALTGLANRRRFDARLAEEVQRSHRHGSALALLLVDIDHFKLYNDRLGHPQGDRALQAVAAVLKQQARRPGELVARYGGEEFALLMPHADAATAATVVERCQHAMATLALPHGASPIAPHVTLSIGAARLDPATRESAAALLQRADMALYAAKAAGRARGVIATDPSPPGA